MRPVCAPTGLNATVHGRYPSRGSVRAGLDAAGQNGP
jgi:hypothetical protein